MECASREHLLAQWKDAADHYAELSASFVNGTTSELTASTNENDALAQLGQAVDTLRLELEQHIKMHGCSTGATTSAVFRTTRVAPPESK